MQFFTVHKSFACDQSPYFDKAFNGPFIEAKKQSITVRADPKIVHFLVQWIYTKSLEDIEGEKPNCLQAVKLWILADELLMPDLQNAAFTFYFEDVNAWAWACVEDEDIGEETGHFTPAQFATI